MNTLKKKRIDQMLLKKVMIWPKGLLERLSAQDMKGKQWETVALIQVEYSRGGSSKTSKRKKKNGKARANKYLATFSDWLSMGGKEAIQRPCLSEREPGKNDLKPDLAQLGGKPNECNHLLRWRNV